MRIISLLAAISVSGCAMTQHAGERCKVFKDVGGQAVPIGLFEPQPELAEELLRLLPDDERSSYVCWYTSGVRLIAAERNNPKSFVYGYSFVQENGRWRLLEDIPEILAVPRVIR